MISGMPSTRRVLQLGIATAVLFATALVISRIRAHRDAKECIRPLAEAGLICPRSWDGGTPPAGCRRGFHFARSTHCRAGQAFILYSLFEQHTCAYDDRGDLVSASRCTDVVDPICGPCVGFGTQPECEFEPEGRSCPEVDAG
jgi:hypothetical protein